MSHPDIVIAPTRQARAWREARDDHAAGCFDNLRSELTAALLSDPQAKVSTPGFGAKTMPAAEVFLDDYAGIGSDERLHTLVRLLGDAAKGEDVQIRAMALIADLATRHAEFHVGDALINLEESVL